MRTDVLTSVSVFLDHTWTKRESESLITRRLEKFTVRVYTRSVCEAMSHGSR